MKKYLTLSALALGIATLSAPSADALGVIWSQTNDYGLGTSKVDPGGNDVRGPDFVTVSDDSSQRFFDEFDFSTLNFASIDRFDLELTFSDAGPNGFFGAKETWRARVPGTDSSFTGDTGGDNSGQANDYFRTLFDAASPQTITVSMSTDTGTIDAFSEAVRIKKFIYGFSEVTGSGGFLNLPEPDDFDLDSAQLDIVGVVPLPGAIWMLGALSGLGLVASRRKSRT